MLPSSGRKDSRLRELHARLCWAILEHKCLYYKLSDSRFDKLRIDDETYDRLESVYRKMCRRIGVRSRLAAMVGFDITRPSASLIYKKLRKTMKVIPVKKLISECKEVL